MPVPLAGQRPNLPDEEASVSFTISPALFCRPEQQRLRVYGSSPPSYKAFEERPNSAQAARAAQMKQVRDWRPERMAPKFIGRDDEKTPVTALQGLGICGPDPEEVPSGHAPSFLPSAEPGVLDGNGIGLIDAVTAQKGAHGYVSIFAPIEVTSRPQHRVEAAQ